MTRIASLLAILLAPLSALGSTVTFINEIHYDNAGSDIGEGIEIAGPAGTALDGWSLLLYNGSTGNVYLTTNLGGTIPDQAGGYGTVHFEIASLQNGAPDGVALIDDKDRVLQFLSYEGSFVANGGPAAGLTSLDIGVFESGDDEPGRSLQLIGSGLVYGDFTWAAGGLESFGAINPGQSFAAVPLPAPLALLAGALGWLFGIRRCERT